jgi:hypothetical protein
MLPPAGYGMMKRIGLSGYAALAAKENEAAITTAHVARTFARDQEIEVVTISLCAYSRPPSMTPRQIAANSPNVR